MKKIFTILFFICAMTLSAFALDFNISVDVRADDQQIEQNVKKYIVQELSSIKDIKVVEEGDWNMRVMILKHKLKDKADFTYSLSAVISSQAKCSAMNAQAKDVSSETCDRLEDFAVYMGGKENLETMSREFISDFNSGVLDFMREPELNNLTGKVIN